MLHLPTPARDHYCCDGCEEECEPCTTGDYIFTTEAVGGGYVILMGDSHFVWSCDGDTDKNSPVWQNIFDLVGTSVVRCSGATSLWNDVIGGLVPGLIPGSTITSGFDIAGSSVIWEGFYRDGSSIGWSTLSSSFDADLASFVQGGGTLIMVSENSTVPGHAAGIARMNAQLLAMGACARFLTGVYDGGCVSGASPPQAVGPGWTAVTNPAHFLIDGTFGTASPEMTYAATSYVCGGDWVAKREGS